MTLIPTGMFLFKSVRECKLLENYAIYAVLQRPETNILKWRIYNAKCKKKKKKGTTEEPIHAHGILESRFLLWGLCLLICMRIVECCSVNEFDATIRWCITISSRICCLARENFPHSVIRCCSNGDAQKKSAKQKSEPLNFGRENLTLGPPHPLLRSFQSRDGGLTVECARATEPKPRVSAARGTK